MLRRLVVEGAEDTHFTPFQGFEGTLWLTYTSVPNLRPLISQKVGFALSNLPSNLSGSASHIHHLNLILLVGFQFCVWICPFSLYSICCWVLYPSTGSTLDPWGLRDPRAAIQTLPRWRVAGAGSVWEWMDIHIFDILPYLYNFRYC